MSDLLNDQDEFDHIVKDKPCRWKFLEEFGNGWKLGKNLYNLNPFQIDEKLRFFLTFIQREGEYHPYYLALRKIIVDWSDREKKGINALSSDWQQVNIIFSAL